MKPITWKYNKMFYHLVILNLELDFEFEPFPGMRQALRALEVGTPEVPSRFLEIKNLRSLHPNSPLAKRMMMIA